MCILCVIQKWSRRVAALLPWLVIPLIGFWALSQLLPPAFRFEITSPKLACVFVLLVTLFWYEVLMPKLSAWRERRNAQLRERKRFQAIELDKLRKTATKRCRNCLTPYRDQNPGAGKFMCSYCGHVSKRPVLDLPVPPSLNSGVVKDLVVKGGKMLNGKGWSENGWICSQDWLENGNWGNGSVSVMSSYRRKNGFGLFGVDENCYSDKSYSGVVVFACKLLTSFFLSIRWIWRKVFRVRSSKEVNSSDTKHGGLMTKRDENGANCHESRGEKARRKAEEKRQARLEKELEEEEERKQREEVARLVEERRKLRDEKMEAEKDRNKSSLSARNNKKELEKKRRERRKDRDKGSSKSNSDAEELDRKVGKESERKREFEKKGETERQEHQKSGTEYAKGHNGELGNGMKNSPSNNFSRGNAGTRYLDRMRGTLLSSSRAFTGSGFFGRTASSTATFLKDNKFGKPIDQIHSSTNRRDIFPPERVAGKSNISGDDKNFSRPVPLEPQPRVAPKKSWQELFTRSASTSPSSSNVISRPDSKLQADGPSPHFSGQSSAVPLFDNPIDIGLPSPLILLSHPNVSASSSLGLSPLTQPKFPHVIDGHHEIIPEEPEVYEDPYISDPISLLGPVSESLDNFQLDLGTGYSSDLRCDEPHPLKNMSGSPEANKPSPIESPLSRIRIGDEKHNKSNWFPGTAEAPDMHTLPVKDAHVNEKGTWQMWNSFPLGQDGLGLVGVSGSWLLPQEQNKSTKEDTVQPPSQKAMASLFLRDDQVLYGTQTPPKVFVSNGQNGGAFNPAIGSSMNEPWLQKAFCSPLTGSDSNFSLKAQEEISQNGMTYRSPSGAVTNHSIELSPVNCSSKKEQSLQGSRECAGMSSVQRPTSEVRSPHQLYSHFGHFIDN